MVYTRCNGFRIRLMSDAPLSPGRSLPSKTWAVDTKYGPALFASLVEAVHYALSTNPDYRTGNLPR